MMFKILKAVAALHSVRSIGVGKVKFQAATRVITKASINILGTNSRRRSGFNHVSLGIRSRGLTVTGREYSGRWSFFMIWE